MPALRPSSLFRSWEQATRLRPRGPQGGRREVSGGRQDARDAPAQLRNAVLLEPRVAPQPHQVAGTGVGEGERRVVREVTLPHDVRQGSAALGVRPLDVVGDRVAADGEGEFHVFEAGYEAVV